MAAKLSLSFDSDARSRELMLASLPKRNTSLSSCATNHSVRPHEYSVAEFYEVEKTVRTIKSRGYRVIALQFPDELLPDSPAVVMEIQTRIKISGYAAQVFVLGDTQYGSCSVDEVSAQHLSADFIVHYGNAYLNPSRMIPVQYIFGKMPINTKTFVTQIKTQFPSNTKAIIFCEAPYTHMIRNVKNMLMESHPNILFSYPILDENGFVVRHKSTIEHSSVEHSSIEKSSIDCSLPVDNSTEKEQTKVEGSTILSTSTDVGSSDMKYFPTNTNSSCCREQNKCQSTTPCSNNQCDFVYEKPNTFLCNPPVLKISNSDSGLFDIICSDFSDSSDEEGETEISARLSVQKLDEMSDKDTKDTKYRKVPIQSKLLEDIARNKIERASNHQENSIPEDTQFVSKRKINGNFYFGGFSFSIPAIEHVDDYNCIYVGQPGEQLSNLVIQYKHNRWYTFSMTFDDSTRTVGSEMNTKKNTEKNNEKWNFAPYSLQIDKFLMRRYFVVEKIRKAKIIGLVAGTLAVSGFKEAMDRAKSLITKSGRKCYSFVVGKLNVPKLANYMEIDVFVLVAAPEYSFLAGAESKEFVKPIATPYELEVALNENTNWTGEYITDFYQLLPKKEKEIKLKNVENSSKLKLKDVLCNVDTNVPQKPQKPQKPQSKILSANHTVQSEALIAFGSRALVEYKSPAGDFLQKREYTGLETRIGETEVNGIIDGLDGIASCFESEMTHEL